MKEQDKDTILARWLAGEISDEEKKLLEESGDLEALKKIALYTSKWQLPELRSNFYHTLESNIKNKREVKVIPLYRSKTIWSIAASVLLVVGIVMLYQLFFTENIVTVACEAGQKKDVYLPDSTLVKLNGYSSISYDANSWANTREVQLSGEAYFEVTQKGPFAVKYAQGIVKVLGTKFNILSGVSLAVVKCYEGKVSVASSLSDKPTILTKGNGVKIYKDSVVTNNFTAGAPDWINGESMFSDATLEEVINSISVQFNVPFEISNEQYLQRKFTGKFIHADLKTALNMVFPAMNIEYTIEGDKKKVVTLK